jgi:hypothetical protein
VQLAVTNQYPQIQQIPAVTTGEIGPVLFPTQIDFQALPGLTIDTARAPFAPFQVPLRQKYFATLSALSHNFSDNSDGDITHSVNQI